MMNIEDIKAEAELRYLILGRELENPEGWKRVVMRNLIIDQERKKKRYREVELKGIETIPEESNENLDRELYSAISRLPERQKEVVIGRLNKKKFKEIASEMGISINTALGIFRYAVNNLRKYMEDESHE